MDAMATRIQKFVTKHELDQDMVDEITTLFKKSIGDLFNHVMDLPLAETTKEKAPKTEKLDTPKIAKTRDDLRNCTKETLNEYCKENGLRVGGNKKEVMDRVWRHMEGESSDDDISPRSKAKKAKAVVEKHECSCKNAKGTMCQITADEEVNGKWYCSRHVKNVVKEAPGSSSDEEDDE